MVFVEGDGNLSQQRKQLESLSLNPLRIWLFCSMGCSTLREVNCIFRKPDFFFVLVLFLVSSELRQGNLIHVVVRT